ncbi:hypothetical protein [Bythopirellula polymerisocia]|uniref:Squalene cyclase C-terminal domain-containing protein n=1 Tax=Bythopirellula polymerisocia TaxID=2528003 RepID=A0A5C6CDG0_9BACT|nr:hypothetical protein [Bythopirellula polymerisocia]TWU22610.1 hypothetical protein Pla144_40700 [Bythopirellula polymerisocia]
MRSHSNKLTLACKLFLVLGSSLSTSGALLAESAVPAKTSAKGKATYPLSVEGPKPAPVTPPSPDEIKQSIERGVEFLLKTQLKQGAWGRSENGKYYRIWSPVPGAHNAYRTATTSLAIMALLDARDLFDGELRERIEQSLDLSQAWLLEHGSNLRRSAPDQYDDYMGYALYNVWGHAYAIQAGIALHERSAGNSDLQSKLKELVAFQVKRLEKDEFINGGWGYYDDPFSDKYGNPVQPRRAKLATPTGSSISFTTATVLIALKQAQEFGIEVPEKVTTPAIASIIRQRYPDFAYAYGEYLKYVPRMDINRPGGSLGRSQVCNLALRLYGDKLVTDEVLETWLNRLFARNGWLNMSRKRNYPGQSPHYADFGVAGYFYYYGHYYASMCIEQLPAEAQPFYQGQLAHVLLPLQESDGSWWDYILYDYHQQYGTSMAISSLVRCLPGEDR